MNNAMTFLGKLPKCNIIDDFDNTQIYSWWIFGRDLQPSYCIGLVTDVPDDYYILALHKTTRQKECPKPTKVETCVQYEWIYPSNDKEISLHNDRCNELYPYIEKHLGLLSEILTLKNEILTLKKEKSEFDKIKKWLNSCLERSPRWKQQNFFGSSFLNKFTDIITAHNLLGNKPSLTAKEKTIGKSVFLADSRNGGLSYEEHICGMVIEFIHQYDKIPTELELLCIVLHDIGKSGDNYTRMLTNDNSKHSLLHCFEGYCCIQKYIKGIPKKYKNKVLSITKYLHSTKERLDGYAKEQKAILICPSQLDTVIDLYNELKEVFGCKTTLKSANKNKENFQVCIDQDTIDDYCNLTRDWDLVCIIKKVDGLSKEEVEGKFKYSGASIKDVQEKVESFKNNNKNKQLSLPFI